METILITGVSGFVGSFLTKFLLNKQFQVIGISRSEGFLDEDVLNNKNFLFIKEDLKDLLVDKLKDKNIKVIFHLASKLPVGKQDYNLFYSSNVEPTLKVVEIAKKLKIQQIIYTSTLSVFGKARNIFNENTIPEPSNYYGLTKYISEKILEIEAKKLDCQISCVRFPSIFGKNHLGGIVYTFYQLAKNDENIEVYSKGQRYRNLIYINNVIELLYQIYQKGEKLNNYEIFMAGSSNSLKIIDIANFIVKEINSHSKIIPVDKFPPSDFDVFIDISKAQKILNFQPMSIEEGLRKYIKDMENENI